MRQVHPVFCLLAPLVMVVACGTSDHAVSVPTSSSTTGVKTPGTGVPKFSSTFPPATVPHIDSAALAHDRAKVVALGFTPTDRYAASRDGVRGVFLAVWGVCTGSADGYCQSVFFFANNRYLGVDSGSPSRMILSLKSAGNATIDVTYPTFSADDPDCCPSGKPRTIRYRWTGRNLVKS